MKGYHEYKFKSKKSKFKNLWSRLSVLQGLHPVATPLRAWQRGEVLAGLI